jgi:hypothetical protein
MCRHSVKVCVRQENTRACSHTITLSDAPKRVAYRGGNEDLAPRKKLRKSFVLVQAH